MAASSFPHASFATITPNTNFILLLWHLWFRLLKIESNVIKYFLSKTLRLDRLIVTVYVSEVELFV